MLQAIIVLAVGTAGFAAAALYLHSGQPAWPPDGIAAPGWWRGAVSVVASVGAAVAVLVARRRLLAEARPDSALALLTTALLLLAAIVALVADLAAVDFRWDEHVYTSMYWIFTAVAATYHAVSLLMVGAVLGQRLVGLVDRDRMLELDATIMMVLFTAVAAAVLLGLLHWLPVVHTVDGVGVPQVGPGSTG
jgi:membrane-associated PAP2 superfamily phosphatase